jgi:DNA-binding transcriptional regulator YhcF (GntR family)
MQLGSLRRGQQLPTHRSLATALRIDLTTATRAYAEARRLGLTEARVGQGTFVAECLSHPRHADAPRPKFDLVLQLPFMQISESMGNHDSKIVDAASVD